MSTQLNKNLMKNIGWLSLLLCSQQVIADSYIYVTNTTPETVSVNINHHGSGLHLTWMKNKNAAH